MPEYIYPTSAEIQEVAQDKLPRLMATRPIFDIFPITESDAAVLTWEQKGNYVGLQAPRGMNGEPVRVKPIGLNRYMAMPGVYGEYETIDELELTTRRSFGTFASPIDITDLVMEKQDQLLGRRLDRIEWIGWTLLATGTFAVSGPNGTVLHTDTYTLQTYTAPVAWATVATAAPLADFRAVKLLSRGHSVSFGSQAKAFMNQTTANQLLTNTNTADVGGKRQGGFIPQMNDIQTLLSGDGLPQLVVYDEGYLDDSGTFQLFIPNNKVVLVGSRPGGDPIADYCYTRNANNPDLGPGPYMRVVDDPDRIPRLIQVHDGHNGGPRVYQPNAIVVMTV